MQLFLIRHPPPAVAPGTCYGSTDLALAAPAAEAANRIRSLLPPGIPLYSSPLRRCRELAEQLHAKPLYDERLREMHFGAWEMQAWSLLGRVALDGWAADPLGFVPPGGESVAQLRRRVLDFLDELGAKGVTAAALVTHAGVMKIAVGHHRALPEGDWLGLAFDYGAVLEIDWT